MPETCPPSADVIRIPVDPQIRLRAALRMLATRLAEQRVVMTEWRETCLTLSQTIRDLADSCDACQRNLDALDINMVIVRGAAAELDQNAMQLVEQTEPQKI